MGLRKSRKGKSFSEWKKSATGRFLKEKRGLDEKALKRSFELNKKFWKDTKVIM